MQILERQGNELYNSSQFANSQQQNEIEQQKKVNTIIFKKQQF